MYRVVILFVVSFALFTSAIFAGVSTKMEPQFFFTLKSTYGLGHGYNLVSKGFVFAGTGLVQPWGMLGVSKGVLTLSGVGVASYRGGSAYGFSVKLILPKMIALQDNLEYSHEFFKLFHEDDWIYKGSFVYHVSIRNSRLPFIGLCWKFSDSDRTRGQFGPTLGVANTEVQILFGEKSAIVALYTVNFK